MLNNILNSASLQYKRNILNDSPILLIMTDEVVSENIVEIIRGSQAGTTI